MLTICTIRVIRWNYSLISQTTTYHLLSGRQSVGTSYSAMNKTKNPALLELTLLSKINKKLDK